MLRKPSSNLDDVADAEAGRYLAGDDGDVTRIIRVACIIFAMLGFTFGFAQRLVALDHRAALHEPDSVRGALDHLLDLRMREHIAIRRARDHLLLHLHQRAGRDDEGTLKPGTILKF